MICPTTVLLLALAGSALPAPQDAERAALVELFAKERVRLDLEHGLVSFPVQVLVRDELLEYLLVGPRGATHESLFLTAVTPSVLNAALLATGVEPGQNARWNERPPPGGGERRADVAPTFDVTLPAGDGFYLYAAWREGEETYQFRVDDLISNLETRRSLRRHRWVYLGSRFKAPREGEPEVFVADLEQNLICLSFFFQGNTLLTAALPECEAQTIWIANSWLLPPRDSTVELVFAREPLERLPEALEAALPRVAAPPPVDDAR